jgi:hypothetical protein
MLRTQAVGVESCRPRSGLLTWHPSASTADSLLHNDALTFMFSFNTLMLKKLLMPKVFDSHILLFC